MLGSHGVSLRVWGCIPHPRALGAWCSPCGPDLCGQATAGEAIQLPFPSLRQSSHCWSPWQCASHRPLSPPNVALGPNVERQGRSRAEARKAPVASPSLVQPALSWAVTPEARQVSAMLAQGRAASRPGLCQIGLLSRAGALPFWRRTGAFPTRACRHTRLGCLIFP